MSSLTLPISCIIVNLNEAKRLREVLRSVNFCDEIIFIDLGSTDESLAIANEFSCSIVHHPKVPIGEIARFSYVEKAKYDWILCVDPDEVFDEQLVKEIFSYCDQPEKLLAVASFAFPWQFYYRGKMLNGTVWGNYQRKKSVLHHRRRVVFPNQVHTVHQRQAGFEEVVVERTGSNVIHHFWCDRFNDLLNKHLRYLKLEGEARHKKGEKYSIKGQLTHTVRAFAESFYFTKGWKAGLDGWVLSFFYAWYVFMSWNSLRKYEIKLIKSAS